MTTARRRNLFLLRTLALLTLLALAAGGCRSKPKPPPPSQELLKRPAIDLSHGGGGFPLESDKVPADTKELVDYIKAAYAVRLQDAAKLKVVATPVLSQQDGLAPLKLLEIDLTGSAVKGDYVPKDGLVKDAPPIGAMQVRELRYTADPLKYQNYSASMRMTAKHAELELSPTNDGKLSLSLTDCRNGRARLAVSLDSLRQSLQEGVKVKRSIAFMIDKVDLNLTSDNPRSLAVEMLVHSRVLLVPATFRLTGRADVDENFYVHFSHLNAAGTNPTGKVVAEIVQSRLDKVNNRAAVLLKLPGDKIKVSNFEIKLNESLTVDVAFKGTQ